MMVKKYFPNFFDFIFRLLNKPESHFLIMWLSITFVPNGRNKIANKRANA